MYCTIYLIFAIYGYINLSIYQFYITAWKSLRNLRKKNLLDFMYKISAKKSFHLKESQEI